MAGVTDLPFRCLCKERGAALAYTEMVSAKALSYKNERTFSYLRTDGEKRPTALQLFGKDPGLLAEAAAEYGAAFDIVDINMGCPAPKIVKNGEGAALMKNPALIGEIIKRASGVSGAPVTVKIRKGFDRSGADAVYAAKTAEQNGAAAVTVHGRYASEGYGVPADWEIIKKVKLAVKIPVIGNGDVKTPADAKRMLDETGCDAVMIGRAACGDPWLFGRINAYLESGFMISPPGAGEKIKTAIDHFERLVILKGERAAAKEMRKHAAWYMKGEKNSAPFRVKINKAETAGEIKKILSEFI